ncbi:MAG: hypothetical protein NC831_02950 [Candidatus Omnitrophica bacterium]|nr:hypothetical protein [Candidatus Omnitrophota bacterium]
MKNRFIFNPRIIRSPWSDFYGRELEDALKTHPESYLKKISEYGYNGVWLHAILRKTVSSSLFPNVKPDKINNLNRLVERTGKYGIKVYLYFCEPRGLKAEDSFWKKHPELKGQPAEFAGISPDIDGRYFALCTGTNAVKEFLEESFFNLFRMVPGLGGVILITASEFHTHCYSHFSKYSSFRHNFESWKREKFVCPRCIDRQPEEVVAEIINLINNGVKKASPEADVIAWTWSWVIIEPDPQKKLISLLPEDVILMSDWERGGYKEVSGKRYPVDEYSFSYTGPSLRFKKQIKIAKDRGMKVMAKIQIGTTHELTTVPYLPVPFLLAEKMRRLKIYGVDGYLGCWIFGGDISPMSRLAGIMSEFPQITPDQAVKKISVEEFGNSHKKIFFAWKKFSSAWKKYPFSIPFLYYGPINYATAYPISLSLLSCRRGIPAIASWMPVPRNVNGHLPAGDNTEHWLKPFSARTITGALRELLQEWEKGIEILVNAADKDSGNQRLRLELNLAQHIFLSIKSTINIIQFYHAIHIFQRSKSGTKRKKTLKWMRKILKEELEISKKDKDLVKFDNRLGYHPEAHTHLFTLKDLDYKISLLEKEIFNWKF